MPSLEPYAELLECGKGRLRLQAKHTRDPWKDKRRIGDRAQVHEAHAIRELGRQVTRELERNTGFTGTTGPGECQEACTIAEDELSNGCKLPVTPDQGCGRSGEVSDPLSRCHFPRVVRASKWSV
jgi:hypothetical protein